MNDVISVLCPTRKRPANLMRFLGSLVGTAAGIVEVMIYVDHDDVETIAAMGLQVTGSTYRALAPRVAQVAVVGPRLPLAEACNIIAWASTGGIIHLAADDLVYRSRDWDDAVRAAFEKIPDRVALVYGRDGNQDERLATHPFLSRRWIDALGYAVPTQFPGVGGDV